MSAVTIMSLIAICISLVTIGFNIYMWRDR